MGLVRSVILWLMTFVRVVMMASLCCLVNCSFSSLSTNLKVSKWFKWLHVTREDEKKRLVAREIDIVGNTEKKLIMVPGITKREREFSFIGTWKNPILPQKTQFRVLFLSLFQPNQYFFCFPKMTQAMSITQLCNVEEEKDEKQEGELWSEGSTKIS